MKILTGVAALLAATQLSAAQVTLELEDTNGKIIRPSAQWKIMLESGKEWKQGKMFVGSRMNLNVPDERIVIHVNTLGSNKMQGSIAVDARKPVVGVVTMREFY